jgi:hypothetical protein
VYVASSNTPTGNITVLAITAANVEYARQLNHLKSFEVSLIFTDDINPKNLERKVANDVTKIAKKILTAI